MERMFCWKPRGNGQTPGMIYSGGQDGSGSTPGYIFCLLCLDVLRTSHFLLGNVEACLRVELRFIPAS